MKALSDYYPPGYNLEAKDYIFEVHGEVTILAYSEEHAEQLFKQNAGEYISDAYSNGNIEYQ